jgi:osmoprotectant transport system ATP-binding protein
MDFIVDIDQVSVGYAGGARRAVREATLRIPAGQFVALVGPSGSGKTSLLKTVNRLVHPSAGAVRIEGRDAAEFPLHELRRRIGYVFQGIGLFPHMSVRENIGITARLLGWSDEKIARRAQETIDLVALPREYLDRAPSQLSGGERQRVAVARALAAEPKIVIMDEPFGALDPVTRDALGRAYRDLHQELGLTTLMVTHDVQEAALLAGRIVVLDQGEIIADGEARAMFSSHEKHVAEMFAIPRRQAERLAHLLERGAHE